MKMFYAKFSLYGTEHSELYFDHESYFKQTYSPLTKDIVRIDFTIHGKSYQEQKESARDVAIEWSNSDTSGLSYGEMNIIWDWFDRMARRYGLLREFRENGIC